MLQAVNLDMDGTKLLLRNRVYPSGDMYYAESVRQWIACGGSAHILGRARCSGP